MEKIYKIVLVENDKRHLKKVTEILDKLQITYDCKFTYMNFQKDENSENDFEIYDKADIVKAVDFIIKNNPNCAILDIDYREADAFHLIDELKKRNFYVPIILYTNEDENHAGDAWKNAPMVKYYIDKLNRQELSTAMGILMDLYEEKIFNLTVNNGNTMPVQPNEFICIKSDGNKCTLYKLNETQPIVLNQQLGNVNKIVIEKRLTNLIKQVSKTNLINVDFYTKSEVEDQYLLKGNFLCLPFADDISAIDFSHKYI